MGSILVLPFSLREEGEEEKEGRKEMSLRHFSPWRSTVLGSVSFGECVTHPPQGHVHMHKLGLLGVHIKFTGLLLKILSIL